MRSFVSLLLVVIFIFTGQGKSVLWRRDNVVYPAPLVASASGAWDGIDGPWSTAQIQTGSPIQDLRVLISTAGQETWLVIPEGCAPSKNYGSSCASSRGNLFSINGSSTWQPASSVWNNTGIYGLGTAIGDELGLSGNGLYGFDKVGLSWSNGAGRLDHTIVAGIVAKDYWLGQFGISPRPTNFTVTSDNSSALQDPQPSYFAQLWKTNMISSLSYSFQAGSHYRSSTTKSAFMQLIFGGYDSARAQPNNVTFKFGETPGAELRLAVQAIQKTRPSQNSQQLLSSKLLAVLDSSQPYVWLPMATCQLFETAFGLTWNSTVSMYLINDTLHTSLVAEQASLDFQLSDTLTDTNIARITIPYEGFVLQANPPLVSNATRYFPLKRAANETQFVLGRAFLQEAYLTVDYERNRFNLSQALWNDTAGQDIKIILPANATTASTSDPAAKLGSGAIAGIAVGAAVILLISMIIVVILRRKRKQRAEQVEGAGIVSPPSEDIKPTDGTNNEELKGDEWAESDIKNGEHGIGEKVRPPSELYGASRPPSELYGASRRLSEMPNNTYSPTLATPTELDAVRGIEMEGSTRLPTELDGVRGVELEDHSHRFELPGDTLHPGELYAARDTI